MADRQEAPKLEPNSESEHIALVAAQAAADKKALDVLVLNVAKTLVITEYFVIATGSTNRQVGGIADEVEERVREQTGAKPIGREGLFEKTWVLLDYGDVVVHVFQPETRAFYRLEKLWSDAPRLEVPGIEPSAEEVPPAESDPDGAETSGS